MPCTIVKSFPQCCVFRCLCFEEGLRDVPPTSDKEEFCASRYFCFRNMVDCHQCPPECALKFFCLDYGHKAANTCTIDTDFPGCCAERLCCLYAAFFQPCLCCGDDDWTHLCKTGCVCCYNQSFRPAPRFQFLCLKIEA
eukprot:m.477174 g.477174  ORF g.477174 m.477174 type:complete len:139 (+) comp20765_c0_seq1:401-817(+)